MFKSQGSYGFLITKKADFLAWKFGFFHFSASLIEDSRTEKSFDWLKRCHYEWNTPGQDAN